MTFYQIKNMERFFQMIDRCSGAVYLEGPDGQRTDLRCNRLIRELLYSACQIHGVERMTVSVEDKTDLPMILDYLVSGSSIRQ